MRRRIARDSKSWQPALRLSFHMSFSHVNFTFQKLVKKRSFSVAFTSSGIEDHHY